MSTRRTCLRDEEELMIPHDLVAMYSAKATEYLIAVTFLLLFIPFWRFVNGGRVAEHAVFLESRRWLSQVADWFLVPDHVHFHPGHAWAMIGDGDLVTVGVDDFAQKLLGSVSALTLPAVGSRVGQGEKAWSLASDSKSVDMLSPVDGTVAAVNDQALACPDILHRDPYGAGWLLKVRAARPAANVKQLLCGALARRWIDEAGNSIQAMMSPDLGRLYQDGGLPIQGIARSVGGDSWDDVCRRFFLT
jgi:glycine cleavage system H lipoate-binding protein